MNNRLVKYRTRSERGQIMGVGAAVLVIMISMAAFYIVCNFCLGYYYQRKFNQAAQIAAQEINLRPTDVSMAYVDQGNAFASPETGQALRDAFRIMNIQAAAVPFNGPPIYDGSPTHTLNLAVGYTALTSDAFIPFVGQMAAAGTAPEVSQVGYLAVPANSVPPGPQQAFQQPTYQVWLPIVKAPPMADSVDTSFPAGSWQLVATPSQTPPLSTNLNQAMPVIGFAVPAVVRGVQPRAQDPR